MKGSIGFVGLAILTGIPQAKGPAIPGALPLWRSDFEDPSLREWSYLGAERLARDGKPGPGWNEACAVIGENVLGGRLSYKGWILAPQENKHRAYPCQHFDAPTPIVNSWYVWLDADAGRFKDWTWIHFATWCNSNWGPGLHMLVVRSRELILEILNCDWKWVGPPESRRFPLRKWVRFTYMGHYAPAGSGEFLVRMNGRLIMEGRNPHRDPVFQRAHWGMYASGEVDNGVPFNDDIKVWRLSAPWPDRNLEPPSPYGPYVNPERIGREGAGAGTADTPPPAPPPPAEATPPERAARRLLEEGERLLRDGEIPAARAFFERVRDTFPGTPYADKAKAHLDRMK